MDMVKSIYQLGFGAGKSGNYWFQEEGYMDNEIIITYEDTLNMLDTILEKRDHDWWNNFYMDRNKPIPFFKDIPDEELVLYCTDGIFTIGKYPFTHSRSVSTLIL